MHPSLLVSPAVRTPRLCLRFLLSGVALALLVCTPAARAGWAAQPLETRLIEADAIVVAKVGAVLDAKDAFTRNNRPYVLAELQVREVLKGRADLGNVQIAFPAKALVAADMVYKEGDEGVWILRQDAEKDFYWANLPTDRQNLKDKDKLVEAIHFVQHLEWGPVTGGVQLLCKGQVVPDLDLGATPKPGDRSANAPPVPALQMFLKNAADRPIYVCDFAGDRPLQLNITGPDGKPFKVDLYDVPWRAPLAKSNYLFLRPGQVRPVGGVAGAYKLKMFPQAGQYSISATYAAARDGKAMRLENVWTGSVTSNAQVVGFAMAQPGPGRK